MPYWPESGKDTVDIYKTFTASVSLLMLSAAPALARVTVEDLVAIKGEPAFIRAVTKGRFFKKGGVRVEFFINGKSIARTMSGGDGAAYREFVPNSTGVYEIRAVSEDAEEAGGVLLSLRKGSRVLYIDVVGALLKSPFSKTPRAGSLGAVEKLSKKNPVVYVGTAIPGRGFLKQWIKEQGFPAGPVVSVEDVELHLKAGLKIHAIVGSKSVVEPLLGVEPEGGKGVGEPNPFIGQERVREPKRKDVRAFSFDGAAGAEQVESWEEILKKL